MADGRELTVGHLRKLIADLPDDMTVCMSDWDTAHLVCYLEQTLVDGGHLLFVPSSCYELWTTPEWADEETYPIPNEWRDDDGR